MRGQALLDALASVGATRGSGVPCSYFGDLFDEVERRPTFKYLKAPNEGTAVAAAAGFALAGELPFVVMQNSGLGNAVNPLTSLVAPYRIPLLLFVSGRAWHSNDEPQHRLMGAHLDAFLEQCGARVFPVAASEAALQGVVAEMARVAREECLCAAMVIPKGTFALAKSPAPPAASAPSVERLTRDDVLQALAARLSSEHVVVATTGFTSRDLFRICDRERNFYMQGSMGHASAIGLGVALSGHPTVVVDGDGACLMHMGALALVGQASPQRFCHVVLDNGAYESTGGQRVVDRPVDFAGVARALGYHYVVECTARADIERELATCLAHDGAACLIVRTALDRANDASPRITEKYAHHEVARRVQHSLRAR